MRADREIAESEIAARLKRAREEASLSQNEVATLTGIPRPSVTNMEGGKRKCSAEELRQLCVIYRVSADWVLGFSLPEIEAARDFIRAYQRACDAERSAQVFPKDVIIAEMRRCEAVAAEKYAALKRALGES